MLSNQTILIISLILLLVKAARVYDLGSNKSYLLPRGPCLLALLLLALMTVTVLRSERSLLHGPLAPLPDTVRLLAILDHYKMGLITVIIIFLIILLIAQLKKAIIRIAKTLQIKVRPRTTATEVITVTIQIIMTLGTVTAVRAIRVIRPIGVQGNKDYQPPLLIN